MQNRDVERLFVYLNSRIETKYREETDMAMDCFLAEEYDRAQLERFLTYLLERVKPDCYEEAFDWLQKQLEHIA